MTAPLNRDQQNELMKNAKARHDARFAAWVSNRVVRETLSRPAPGQDDQPRYERETRRIACG
ncbi:hypothetical protein [uncultured Sphingomonas sp.]|uniref:hypothetical protein n=1 Tax=uncultured Sphingomonas sp. TaxID=158754 RepID=UPI0025CF5E11|nr:hypothetical protein [uncultured Sphingomonas sp.]